MRPSCIILSSPYMVITAKPVPGLSQTTLARFVMRARRMVKLSAQVNVLVTDDAQMRELNRKFRKKDKATDVLSFPSLESVSAKNGNVRFAGDLAISCDIAAANAEQLGHSLAAEIKILVLHGLLHLAGYDHEQDAGEMARKEARMRRELRLPESLTERGAAAEPAPRRRRA